MLFHCCCCFTLERRKVAGGGQQQMGKGQGRRQGNRMRHGERSLFCSISMSPPAGNYKRIETFGMNLRLCVVAVVHWRLLPLLSPLLRERTEIAPPHPLPLLPSPPSPFLPLLHSLVGLEIESQVTRAPQLSNNLLPRVHKYCQVVKLSTQRAISRIRPCMSIFLLPPARPQSCGLPAAPAVVVLRLPGRCQAQAGRHGDTC